MRFENEMDARDTLKLKSMPDAIAFTILRLAPGDPPAISI
jgi:hypothetical protein